MAACATYIFTFMNNVVGCMSPQNLLRPRGDFICRLLSHTPPTRNSKEQLCMRVSFHVVLRPMLVFGLSAPRDVHAMVGLDRTTSMCLQHLFEGSLATQVKNICGSCSISAVT